MLAWQLAFSQFALRRLLSLLSPWRSTSRTRSFSLTAFPTTLSSPRSIRPLPLPASSVMGTSPLPGLSLRLAMFTISVHLHVCHRSGASAFSICGLPRLQLSAPLLFGFPPLPALVLRSPRGGSCRRVHEMFRPSVLCFILQSLLLPSAHSLRMIGSVSPFLR